MRLVVALLAISLIGCGDDGGQTPIDASVIDSGSIDSGGPTIDAGADAGGGQGEGQFCIVLECLPELTCCADEICRASCDTNTGISCNGKVDCNGGDVCCDLSTSQMCTPKKTCGDLGGTELP